jgi:ATP-binding cassette subfamily F protein 3
MTRALPQASPGAVRAQLGRFGFSGHKATTQIAKLSGGERARLALALITRDAPHLLILDEPTNHLDVDAREALVQALNDFDGAVILISHDRHMVELTADRLVLVDNGTAEEYAGSIEDYIDFVLGRNQPKDDRAPKAKKDRRATAKAREGERLARHAVTACEKRIARLQKELAALDEALANPAAAAPGFAGKSINELVQQRAAFAGELEGAELEWLEASENLDMAGA